MLPALAADLDPENTLYMDIPYGRVVIKLRPDLAPNHVAQVKKLARQGFYDGTPFHRVIEGFMAQGGDPTGTGMGGSKLPDLKAEFTNTPFVRGVIGAARSDDPDSANSQFFIMLRAGAEPQRAVHGVGRGGGRDGPGRQDQARRAAGQTRQDRQAASRSRRQVRNRWPRSRTKRIR